MKLHRLRRQSGISAKPRFVPSALPADQISGIYEKIEACYEKSYASVQIDKPFFKNNWQFYGVTVGPIIPCWGVAIILVKWFPHNEVLLKLAQVLFIVGYVPYAGFGLFFVIRFVRMVLRTMKRGALDDFILLRKKGEIESQFVNEVSQYDESVRRFTLTQVKLLRSDLELWPKHLLGSLGIGVGIFAYFRVPGVFRAVLAPQAAKTLPNPHLSPFDVIAALLVFVFHPWPHQVFV